MANGPEYISGKTKTRLECSVAAVACALLLPLALPAAAGAMVDTRSRSPFYKQQRGNSVTRKLITIADPEGTNAHYTYGTRDPRASWYGNLLRATCADELPQLLSVLSGSMMLYGVRDILDHERERMAAANSVLYNDFEQAVQESGVKPSIFSPSSAWRKSIRYDTTDRDMVKAVDIISMELDFKYLSHEASLRTDLRAIGRLPLQVLTGITRSSPWESFVDEGFPGVTAEKTDSFATLDILA